MGPGPFGKGPGAKVLFRRPRLNLSEMEMSHHHGGCCRSCEKDNIIVMRSDNSALSTLIMKRQQRVFLACSSVRLCLCVSVRKREGEGECVVLLLYLYILLVGEDTTCLNIG